MHRFLPALTGVALLACEPAPSPVPTTPPPEAAPTLPSPHLPSESPAPTTVRLDTPGPRAVSIRDAIGTDTTIALAERVPKAAGPIPLDDWQPGTEAGTWTHPSPTRFDHNQYRATPPGTALLDASGTAVPFAQMLVEDSSCGKASTCWEVQKGTIAYKGPEPSGFTLRHAATEEDERRRTPALAQLPAEAFVTWTAQIGALTREVLLVPAGSRITQPIQVPEGASLRFGFGAPPDRIALPVEAVQGEVSVDDTPIWSGTTTTGSDWTEHSVDLSAYSGQTVRLSFATTAARPEAQGTVVAFAEPELAPGPRPDQPPRRVVIVGLDTLRLDHLGLHGGPDDLTPGLDAWGQSAILFDQARAPAPRTRPSFRSALTGRWPLAAIGAPPLSRTFADAGFSTAGIVANVHLQPHLGFADGAGWWDYHDSDDAGPQVDRAIAWLDAHQHEDSFLFLHLMDPHIFYLAPEPFQDAFTTGHKQAGLPDRYNRWTIEEAMKKGSLKPVHQRFIQARYKGEVRYLDQELSRLLHHIDQLPGDTVVVLHSDHGEELWDHGGFEHNHTLYDELMRTMLWIRPPGGWSGGPVRVSEPVSLVDIAPTLHELFQLTPPAASPLDGLSLAAFLDPNASREQQHRRSELKARPLPMGHMMFAREQWGVVHQGWTYTLETATGSEEAYFIEEDPTQQNNRVHDAPLSDLRVALSEATGYPVGSGWRIKVDRTKAAFALHFDTPVRAAGVLDPEAHRTRRANIEWGEVPPVLPADVATVTVQPDGHTVEVVPGDTASGTLYVLGPGPSDSARVTTDGMPDYTVTPGTRMLGRGTARIAAGTLIVPTTTEARALADQGDPRLYEALRAMGYIE